MKKIMLLLLTCLFAFPILSVAQGQEHLKFMGIPLDGTITQFQAKLQAKGVNYDTQGSKVLSVGTRAFRGTFSGKKAFIYVYYNEKTKVVYRAKAVVHSTDEDIADNSYYYFVGMLKQKYDTADIETGTKDNHEALTLLVPNENENTYYKYLGRIDVYRTRDYPNYDIHIDYYDTLNTVNNDNRNMDDL